MPATSHRVPLSGAPKPFLHKGSGQSAVKFRGRFYYLGKHGSKAAREVYLRIEQCRLGFSVGKQLQFFGADEIHGTAPLTACDVLKPRLSAPATAAVGPIVSPRLRRPS